MNNSRVYFDIDKTLIDTHKMLENIQHSVEKSGVTSEVFELVISQYFLSLQSKTFFNPEELTQKLHQASGVDEQVLAAAFWVPDNFSTALFPEALTVITYLSSKVALGIFSQGVPYWQRKKLELAGLSEFFQEDLKIIEENKLSEEAINRISSNGWVIDDKRVVVEHLRAARNDITALLIDRSDDTKKEGTIHSLNDVVSILGI